jgi:hypothetical protein
MSKRKNFQMGRRRLRRMEKQATEAEASPTRDKTIGRACRRGWGTGAVL